MVALSVIGAAVGIVGGIAGLWSFGWAWSDRRKRKNISNLPRELRPALLDLLPVIREVTVQPQDYAWIQANLTGPRKKAEELLALASEDNDARWVRLHLSRLSGTGNNSLIRDDPARIARDEREQADAAAQLSKYVQSILKRMSDATD